MAVSRRQFVRWSGAALAAGMAGGCASTVSTRPPAGGRVVVIGGGYGGTTAANHLRQLAPQIEVVMIERDPAFVSCPLSNRVLAGTMKIEELTRSYDTLSRNRGVIVVRGEAARVEPDKRLVVMGDGSVIGYDRLIMSPGIDFLWSEIPAMAADPEAASQIVPHAWKAGAQTTLLRKQLEAMPDGGVYAIHIPAAPYRCPPGPYERVSQVAWYLSRNKPRSKILILDANDSIQSKPKLFAAAWDRFYKGMVEYRPNSRLLDVDLKSRTARLEFEDVKAAVLNVVPPQRAGNIARETGVMTTQRWCEVDFLTYESLKVKNIHVLGDAILAAPAMPKSGHMANQHAKICASAIAELMSGRAPFQSPMAINTCYSFLTEMEVIRVSSVHRYDVAKRTMLTVPGSGGLSDAPSALEGAYALQWAQNIWANMLT